MLLEHTKLIHGTEYREIRVHRKRDEVFEFNYEFVDGKRICVSYFSLYGVSKHKYREAQKELFSDNEELCV